MEETFVLPVVKEDRIAQKLHSIAQYIIVGLFGILPILFVPYAEFSLPFTKTAVAVAAVLIALTLYSFAVLRSGTFRVSLPLPVVAMWLLVINATASAFLSGDVRGSFFGDFFEPQTVVFLAIMALTTTVTLHVMTDKRRVYSMYLVLALSTLVLSLFHFIRLFFGANVLGFGIFNGNQVLTPVGTWNDLAIFFGLTILLAIVALEQLSLKRNGKALFVIVSMLSLGLLAVINFSPVWYILLVVSLIVLVYSLARDRMTPEWLQGTAVDRQLSAASLSIAGIVFITSFVFIAGGAIIGGKLSAHTGVSYVEVRPSLQATAGIMRDTLKTDPLFGVGPNKFVNAWRLHRDASLNTTLFWNTDFLAGVGYIPTFFVTTGIIGGLLWILFLVFFLMSGIRMLLGAVSPDRTWYFIGTSAFVAGLYVWGLSVIYVPGAMLLLMASLCTGIVLAARNALEPHRERTIAMTGNRRSGFILVSLVMLVVIGAMSGLYTTGQQYASAFMFSQSERAVQRGDIATAKAKAVDAGVLSNNDRYLRRGAEIEYAELIQVIQVLNLPGDTPGLETRFRDALRNSITDAGRATAIDGTDADNWSILGAIFTAVVPYKIEGAADRAREALEKARALDPQNPVRTLMLARLAFANGKVDDARNLMNDAIRQKPDYVDAAFMLSQLEIAAGNVDGAINSTIRIIQLEPQNPARYFQLGVLELSKQDIEKGVVALQVAIQLDPQYANAHYYLAFAYDKLGRTAEARAELLKVLATNPGNADVAKLISRLDNGEKISAGTPAQANTDTPAETTTATETKNNTAVKEKLNSPLLTPVNPVPEKKK